MGERSLSVGCGGNMTYSFRSFGCDVQVDIEKPTFKIPNFVLCDVYFLPFKDKTFTKIVVSHLIEHLEEPQKAIKEMKRVCSDFIQLFYPQFFSPFAYLDPNHRWIIMNETFVRRPKILQSKLLIPIMSKLRDKTQKMTRFRMPFLVKEKIIEVNTK